MRNKVIISMLKIAAMMHIFLAAKASESPKQILHLAETIVFVVLADVVFYKQIKK